MHRVGKGDLGVKGLEKVEGVGGGRTRAPLACKYYDRAGNPETPIQRPKYRSEVK